MNDFLMHYGVKGQNWGVRRYQNEDGTLTEEGKEHYGVDDSHKRYDTQKQRGEYLKTLNKEQRKTYNSLSFSNQKRFWKHINNGKSFDKAYTSIKLRNTALNLGVTAAALYINPYTRPLMKLSSRFIKSSAKFAFRAIKNSNALKVGSMWMKKMMQRKSAVKNGAVVLKKSAYSVKDYVPKFGGYLH